MLSRVHRVTQANFFHRHAKSLATAARSSGLGVQRPSAIAATLFHLYFPARIDIVIRQTRLLDQMLYRSHNEEKTETEDSKGSKEKS